jgi:hypothetical protein
MRGWSSAAAAAAEAARFRLDCGCASPSASPSSSKSPPAWASSRGRGGRPRFCRRDPPKKSKKSKHMQRNSNSPGVPRTAARLTGRRSETSASSIRVGVDLMARLGGANPSKRFWRQVENEGVRTSEGTEMTRR